MYIYICTYTYFKGFSKITGSLIFKMNLFFFWVSDFYEKPGVKAQPTTCTGLVEGAPATTWVISGYHGLEHFDIIFNGLV
jgi:hypothetical protein